MRKLCFVLIYFVNGLLLVLLLASFFFNLEIVNYIIMLLIGIVFSVISFKDINLVKRWTVGRKKNESDQDYDDRQEEHLWLRKEKVFIGKEDIPHNIILNIIAYVSFVSAFIIIGLLSNYGYEYEHGIIDTIFTTKPFDLLSYGLRVGDRVFPLCMGCFFNKISINILWYNSTNQEKSSSENTNVDSNNETPPPPQD